MKTKMKILLSLLVVLVLSIAEGKAQQYYVMGYFNDVNFKNAIPNSGFPMDTNGDHLIDTQEMEVSEYALYVQNSNISDLSGPDSTMGIGYFKNIYYLNVSNNRLTTLNLRQNFRLQELHCSYNQITSILLPDGFSEELYCSNNNLSELDLSNTKCRVLDCRNNPLLTSICLSASSFNYLTIHPENFLKDSSAEWVLCENTTGAASVDANKLSLTYDVERQQIKVENAEKIEVYDLNGRKKISQCADIANVSGFSNGIYIVKAQAFSGEVFVDKIIKL